MKNTKLNETLQKISFNSDKPILPQFIEILKNLRPKHILFYFFTLCLFQLILIILNTLNDVNNFTYPKIRSFFLVDNRAFLIGTIIYIAIIAFSIIAILISAILLAGIYDHLCNYFEKKIVNSMYSILLLMSLSITETDNNFITNILDKLF